MKRKQLSGKRIGIVFGTFAPMHIGHVDLITKAKRYNDNVLVIVSGSNDQEDREHAPACLSTDAFVMFVKYFMMTNLLS